MDFLRKEMEMEKGRMGVQNVDYCMDQNYYILCVFWKWNFSEICSQQLLFLNQYLRDWQGKGFIFFYTAAILIKSIVVFCYYIHKFITRNSKQ